MALTSLSAFGCTSDAPPVDAAPPLPDAPDARATCETPLGAIPRGELAPHAAPLGSGPAEARAGVLAAADLPDDSTGLALYRTGDFVLANDRIAVMIEDAGDSDLFDPWGGKPIGLGRIEGGRIVAAADFEEMIPALGLYTLHTEHVGVLADGSDGGPAIVRAVGIIEAIPFLAAFVPGGLVSGVVDGVPAALDWSLAPGADHVEVSWVLDNVSPRLLSIATPIHTFLQTSRMPPWAPTIGFDVGAADAYPYVAFVDEDRASYAYIADDGDLTLVLAAGGANFYATPRFQVPGCTRLQRRMGRLYVGDRDGLGGALRVVARSEGRTLSDLTVSVRDSTGAPAPGIDVSATTVDGGHLERRTSDASGALVLAVPSTEELRLVPVLGGVVVGPATTVAAGSTTAVVTLDPLMTVDVTTLDAADRTPIPARLQAIAMTPLARPPASFGARIEQGERAVIAFEIDGAATFRLPVGSYRIVGSRGYEWELDEAMVDLAPGAPVPVELLLTHVVDTTNVLCGDFHIHTNRSPDAPDGAAFKIESGVADGLEVPARSDHEFVAEFEDTIATLGAGDYAYGVTSLELTTYAWGHFGVLPLDPDPSRANGGAVEWAYRTPPEVLADARSRTSTFGPAAIVVNHPRDSGAGRVAFAYFEAAGYDPVTGTASNPELWDPGFSLIEVFNDSNFDRNADGPVRDWFSFLSRGLRTFAVGSSDSHGVQGSPLGYPRTCMELGTDSTATLRTMGAGAVRDALLGGHSTISGGLYVDARVGTAGPGDEATGVGARAMVSVMVQAASWIDADRLRVFVDGAMVEEIPFTSADAILRFDDVVEVDVAAGGSWVVFVASGDAMLEPVHPGRLPFAVTNPIFLAR